MDILLALPVLVPHLDTQRVLPVRLNIPQALLVRLVIQQVPQVLRHLLDIRLAQVLALRHLLDIVNLLQAQSLPLPLLVIQQVQALALLVIVKALQVQSLPLLLLDIRLAQVLALLVIVKALQAQKAVRLGIANRLQAQCPARLRRVRLLSDILKARLLRKVVHLQ